MRRWASPGAASTELASRYISTVVAAEVQIGSYGAPELEGCCADEAAAGDEVGKGLLGEVFSVGGRLGMTR
jgi:hypothetical protein